LPSLLQIDGLTVDFATEDGVVHAVRGVSLNVNAGQMLGVVGESGSGKSVTMLTVMGLTRGPGTTIGGTAKFDGRDLLTLPGEDLRRIRGRDIAMIFQDPLSSLHPFYKVGTQLIEAIQAHRDVPKREARERTIELLKEYDVLAVQADRADDARYAAVLVTAATGTVIASGASISCGVEGIAGSTILGDGSVALILDVPSILRTAVARTRAGDAPWSPS
jgi:ABC-type glutathione transport system ATPase component